VRQDAAQAFGMSRSKGYDLVQAGPVEWAPKAPSQHRLWSVELDCQWRVASLKDHTLWIMCGIF
jgi:hypothetical protein